MPVDASDRPNDRFGYSVYATVALAAPDQVAKVRKVREAIGLKRATIPAHVTVRGTFYGVQNFDELAGLLRNLAFSQKPLRIEFSGGWEFWVQSDGRGIGWRKVMATVELRALNKTFDGVIRPRSNNAYPDEFLPHLTLCQDCDETQIAEAKRLAESLDIGSGFDCKEVTLMGRVGPAHGGRWVTVESFPLGGWKTGRPLHRRP